MSDARAARGAAERDERELRAMAAELDRTHTQTLPVLRRTVAVFSTSVAHLRTSSGEPTGRRSFLLGLSGLGGLALASGLAACTGSDSGSGAGGRTSASTRPSSTPPSTSPLLSTSGQPAPTPSTPSATSTAGSPYLGDLHEVALAAALENLAITVYGTVLQLAGSGRLGRVPAAVTSFATTVMAQHRDHASAWNGVLAQAGLPRITGTPLAIADTELAKARAARTIEDAAGAALALENIAAATYTSVVGQVSDAGTIVAAASIAPVEAMHATILQLLLGHAPVPSSDIGTGGAVTASMLTV